jgi:hypothetical protein
VELKLKSKRSEMTPIGACLDACSGPPSTLRYYHREAA